MLAKKYAYVSQHAAAKPKRVGFTRSKQQPDEMSLAAMLPNKNARNNFESAAAPSTEARSAPASRKPGSRSLWRTIAWPFVLTCGFLIFVIGSSIYLVVASQSTGELVSRTLRIRGNLLALLRTVGDAESGQRGYLLTGDPVYLDSYHAAASAAAEKIASAKSEMLDKAQLEAFAEMEPFISRKFAELAETIRLYDSGNAAAALALVHTGIGRDLMTEIRARTLKLSEGEQRLLLVRTSNSAAVERWLLAVNLVGLVLVIALVAISILVMRRLAEKELAYMGDLERSNQELDDFAYIASHDLKEPLRGLFNHATFLLEDYKDKIDVDGVRRLTRLGLLCQRMERLINDLMYFSRLGRADLAVQGTDPNAVIVEIQQMMETLLSERRARIVVPSALPQIVCDKTRVTEVFRNLITNAVKYNDKTERLVEIGFLKSVNTEAGPERNVFYVKDNGVGIDPEFHQEIFRIFKRLQNASDGSDTGTGVGLTFVKKIVERHGGRIWLESEPGKGTVFYFNLNRERNVPVRSAHESAIDPIPVHSAG
jgi:signal transduction histidine kinase